MASPRKVTQGGKSRGSEAGNILVETPVKELMREKLLAAYQNMLLARRMDEKMLLLLKQGKVFFHIGVSGHEAIQTAVALALRPGFDWAYPYYRGLAFSLQLGVSVDDVLLNALHRAADPSTGGRQMPAHYGDRKLRIPTQSSPTGTQYLQAVGTAMGVAKDGSEEVVYVSSGEGSTSEGEFHEAVNWASRERYPVIFCIENNKWAISVPISDQVAGDSVYEMTAGYRGLNRYLVDGTNFLECYKVAVEAIEKARRGEGPALIDADVVRLLPHSSSDDHSKYRSKEDIEADRRRDPILSFERYLIEQGILAEAESEHMRHEIIQRVDEAADRAENEPLPDPTTAVMYVYSPSPMVSKEGFVEPEHSGQKIVMVDAVNHALAEEMERNPRMLIYGQDVAGRKGGVFTATKGLTEKFGPERVFNSPLAEASIVGTATGLALRGHKPVVEVQFGDYIWPAMMQLKNELAMYRYRSHNTWSCPVVVRVAVGGYIHGGHYHSQNIESIFLHCPGLRIVYPSTAADVKGLLKTACREEDPVLFLEHKGMYRQSFAGSPEPDADYLLPFGLAKVVREGEDITIITYGMMVQRSLEAARKLEDQGVSVEVVDLRTLNPLDEETMLNSAKKTGKVLIVHEDTRTTGFGGDLAAIIMENAFQYLDGPVLRVASKDAPIPYSPPLESAVLVQERDITKALEELARF
ncbi:MAG: thiamine pyrophosphate-dependent enzyme [Bacteroidota bacterium]